MSPPHPAAVTVFIVVMMLGFVAAFIWISFQE